MSGIEIAYFLVLIAFIIGVAVLAAIIGGWYGIAIATFLFLLAYKNNKGEF